MANKMAEIDSIDKLEEAAKLALLRLIGNLQMAQAELAQGLALLKRIEEKLREDFAEKFGSRKGD